MTAPTITPLPDPPLRSDDAATFNAKAEAFVEAQEGLPAEINAFGEYLNGYVPSFGPPIPAGRWILPDGAGITVAGSAPTAATMKGFLGYLRRACTIEGLGIRTYTGVAGGNMQLGIYAAHSTNLWPTGAPLTSTSSIAVTANNTAYSDTSISVALAGGWYWFFSNTDTNGGTATFHAIATNNSTQAAYYGATNPIAYATTGISKSQAFNSWPTLTGNFTTDSLATVSAATVPAITYLT